ncbi:hypothetical protein GCM10011413_14620 [Pedobacter psychrotolerans]|uniref:Serine aminopeptidase S33 domain-containing protein n=1 Tax=Pedobacter psychrotolerans TaxID=1843235 RepID=A0ABQ1SNK1_9SPHI|nr:hypothetical protein GCM10011413_14620 [Pedobacter psychrotolerans]
MFGQTASDSTHEALFTIENTQFKSAGITLAGAIFKPRHPNAAVVIVHGSGQERKMAEVASLLAKKGIAVLTYDKRGVGESGGVYAGPEVGTNNIDSANLNLLASDASAAANKLSSSLKQKHVPLGLLGFSQAGWIIPMAAEKNSLINFIVIFSGPVVTSQEQLRFQFYTSGKSNFWDTHTEVEVREHIKNDPDRYQFSGSDPRHALTVLKIPGLWIYGGKDIQAPVGLSIERLDIFKAEGKPYDYQLFPSLGHNTASSKTVNPMNIAIEWIKHIKKSMKSK